MIKQKGIKTKNVYIEVSDELWSKLKIACFNRSVTIKQFVTEIIEKELKNEKL